MIFLPSCQLRYALTPFYSINTMPPTPSTSLQPPPAPSFSSAQSPQNSKPAIHHIPSPSSPGETGGTVLTTGNNFKLQLMMALILLLLLGNRCQLMSFSIWQHEVFNFISLFLFHISNFVWFGYKMWKILFRIVSICYAYIFFVIYIFIVNHFKLVQIYIKLIPVRPASACKIPRDVNVIDTFFRKWAIDEIHSPLCNWCQQDCVYVS